MDEHAKTEQNLSEELLQQITGGCGDCLADLDRAARHQGFANDYTRAFEEAIQQGNASLAAQHLDFAHQHAQQSAALWGEVAARQGTPEHPIIRNPAPGRS